jgi:hypothetical protein
MKAQTTYYIGKTNNTILQKYGVENKENGVEFWIELEC